MSFFESHGRKIYYERQGSGPAVLFLHGAGSNAATWWQQLPAFKARHTCLTVDLRGFGRSVAPLAEFSLDRLVIDVLGLLDHTDIRRASVVGQSLGGMVGLRLALRHPARVAAFVAADSPLAIAHAGLLDIMAKRRVAVRAVAIEERGLGKWFLQHHPDKAALYAQINHFNPSSYAIPADEWDAAIAALLKPATLVPLDEVATLVCPTMFLVGSEDPLVPVSVMRELGALVKDSEVVVITDAAHSAYFEKAQEFNREVLDFLVRRARY